MLEHGDGHHPVKGFVQVPVILHFDLNLKPLADFPGIGHLFFGNRDAGDANPVVPGGIACKPAPAAADVQNPQE
jgi:hypothetical protein